MQTLTFTPKLLRQRRFFSFLLPLFALFAGLGLSNKVQAQAFYNSNNLRIVSQINPSATASNTLYLGRNATTSNSFEGKDLGTRLAYSSGTTVQFNQTGGRLELNQANANLGVANSNTRITASAILYRVYLESNAGQTLPAYSRLALNRTSAADNTNPVTFSITGQTVDLLRQPQVLGGGTYIVEVVYESTVSQFIPGAPGDPGDPTANPPIDPTPPTPDQTVVSKLTDPSGGTGFRAKFTVAPPTITPAGGTTTWISTGTGAMNTNWLNPANWSNGVPNRNSNAIFPPKPPAGPFTVTPSLNDPTALYEVQTLTLEDPNNDTRALVRVGQSVSNGNGAAGTSPIGATLRIYGDLNNFGGGLLASVSGTNGSANPALNSTVVFAGDAATFTLDANGNQVLTGGNQIIRGLTTVVDVRIEGTGIKGVVNVIQATNTFTFATANAIVRTITDSPTFPLNTSKIANVELGSSGILLNETNNAFIEGITLSERMLMAGVKQTFGNIGLDITPDRDVPAPAVIITRTVGRPFSGPVGTRMAIKRQYGVSGDVNNNTISTIVFHYLDSDGVNSPYNELNGNPEPNLVMFKTGNNGIPFQLVGGTVNVTDNTVTKSGVGSINTITLGDRNNPLPVTVASFDTKRIGTDALVSWSTAQEINNKGFNVQVSIDAKMYRTIGFVASETPNSSSLRSYSFTDTEKNKIGVRYYRLQQMDTDGKTAFFAPRAITFEGRATEAGIVAYPNPYNTELRIGLNSTVSGNGLARITDMTGRVISQQVLPIAIGSNDLSVENMNGLKNGLYLLNLTLPSGETKTMKVVKQ